MKFKDLDESFYHSNKMNKIVQTPMQNIPDPNSGGATGGTTMVTKAYRDLQKDRTESGVLRRDPHWREDAESYIHARFRQPERTEDGVEDVP